MELRYIGQCRGRIATLKTVVADDRQAHQATTDYGENEEESFFGRLQLPPNFKKGNRYAEFCHGTPASFISAAEKGRSKKFPPIFKYPIF